MSKRINTHSDIKYQSLESIFHEILTRDTLSILQLIIMYCSSTYKNYNLK